MCLKYVEIWIIIIFFTFDRNHQARTKAGRDSTTLRIKLRLSIRTMNMQSGSKSVTLMTQRKSVVVLFWSSMMWNWLMRESSSAWCTVRWMMLVKDALVLKSTVRQKGLVPPNLEELLDHLWPRPNSKPLSFRFTISTCDWKHTHRDFC